MSSDVTRLKQNIEVKNEEYDAAENEWGRIINDYNSELDKCGVFELSKKKGLKQKIQNAEHEKYVLIEERNRQLNDLRKQYYDLLSKMETI